MNSNKQAREAALGHGKRTFGIIKQEPHTLVKWIILLPAQAEILQKALRSGKGNVTVFGQGLIQAKCLQRLGSLNHSGHQGFQYRGPLLSAARAELFSTMSPFAS